MGEEDSFFRSKNTANRNGGFGAKNCSSLNLVMSGSFRTFTRDIATDGVDRLDQPISELENEKMTNQTPGNGETINLYISQFHTILV